jgi:hypothetical protein
MSETNYTAINGQDLAYIFASYSSGSSQQTSYKVNNVDLNTIFQPYDGTSIAADATGFTVNGADLNTIFQNIVTNAILNYNPFSCSTDQTGYYYRIFNATETIITLNTTIPYAYIVLVGGGGGGGSGLGYSGGGAGGSVTTAGPITLETGDYSITIGTGGIGGAYRRGDFNGNDGSTGGSTIVTGPNGFNYVAEGGKGGKGSSEDSIGLGGTNSNTPKDGYGGTYGVNVTNANGNGTGYGNDGYPYTFQDGTPTVFKFGGGGGAGGRNSGSSSNTTYYGGGGIVGTVNGITYTSSNGGCGGTGYSGIVNGAPGNDFSFNSIYNTGSGGGAGGNSSAYNYTKGGTGNDGIVFFYWMV